jgi:hypothetical protein
MKFCFPKQTETRDIEFNETLAKAVASAICGAVVFLLGAYVGKQEAKKKLPR